MQIYKLKIEGFKKIFSAEFNFGSTTFLLGANNCGKSTVLKALEILLNSESKQRISINDFHSVQEEGGPKALSNVVIITAEFRDVADDYHQKRGFKGRIHKYTPSNTEDTGNQVTIRKVFEAGKDVKLEILSKKRNLKDKINNLSDLMNINIPPEDIQEVLGLEKDKFDPTAKITAAQKKKFEDFDEIYDYEDENVWVSNPGGLLNVFMNNLPKYVEIPALHSLNELESKNGAMQTILSTLFEEVRSKSDNYIKASEYLGKLSSELNPDDEDQDFGKLLRDLNGGFKGIFPGAKLNVSVDLSDPNKSITPTFNVQASSNVQTSISGQGTGLSRSALFSLLKFRAEWLEKRAEQEGRQTRKIIIGFEEPELYLHPSAAQLIRDFIYSLANTKTVQIACTTHSTAMLDLSREKDNQIINHLIAEKSIQNGVALEQIKSKSFNIDKGFTELQGEDKSYVKMLIRVDDQFSKAFFTEKCVFFEGDSEQIAFMETIKRMPEETRLKILSKYSFVNARGKATLISLIKYAKALGLDVIVVHDLDTSAKGAEVFNSHIKNALNNDGSLHPINECLEDILGMSRATSEKPLKVYKHISTTWTNFSSLPESWTSLVSKIFALGN